VKADDSNPIRSSAVDDDDVVTVGIVIWTLLALATGVVLGEEETGVC